MPENHRQQYKLTLIHLRSLYSNYTPSIMIPDRTNTGNGWKKMPLFIRQHDRMTFRPTGRGAVAVGVFSIENAPNPNANPIFFM